VFVCQQVFVASVGRVLPRSASYSELVSAQRAPLFKFWKRDSWKTLVQDRHNSQVLGPHVRPLPVRLVLRNSAEVAKAEASELRAEEAETLKAKAEELAASLDQEVRVGS